MRSETDGFYACDSNEYVEALMHGDNSFEIAIESLLDRKSLILNKQQAREFARQLLEMCGEE